jgi:Domain of unknown function (DUF4304)
VVASSASLLFAAFMRDVLGPPLRELGFRGSSRHYSLPSETHWALLGFQTSKWSTAKSVEFTVNVTVVARDAWLRWRELEPYDDERPSANVSYGPAPREMDSALRATYWHERLGLLLPEHRDHWWQLRAGRDSAPVARDVVTAIRDHALPEMRKRIAS